MSNTTIPIIDQAELHDGYFKKFQIEGKSILLIMEKGNIHVIENKCGHFGIELSNGTIDDGTIICSQHGISFNLKTGEVDNRPYENCDPIVVYDYKIIENKVCVILDD